MIKLQKNLSKKKVWMIIPLFILILFSIDLLILRSAKNEYEHSVDKIEKSADEITAGVEEIASGIVSEIDEINESDVKSWSIYQNKKYGFSFRYPQYYSMSEYPGNGKPKEPKLVISFSAYNDEFTGRIAVMIFDSSLSEVLGEATSSLDDIQKNKIQIAGKTGSKITGISSGNILSQKNERIALVGFENNENTFIITGEDNDVLAKILSTIQL